MKKLRLVDVSPRPVAPAGPLVGTAGSRPGTLHDRGMQMDNAMHFQRVIAARAGVRGELTLLEVGP